MTEPMIEVRDLWKSFNGNQVSSNGFSVLTDNVGGILFGQTSTLSAFVGNSVHDNNGNQVAFTC